MSASANTEIGVPQVSINFALRRVNNDPFQLLANIRDMGPVVYNRAPDAWMVAPFTEARQVLRDGAHFDQDTETMLRAVGGHHLTTLQPPLHTAVRNTIRHDFERGTLHERWEGMVQAVVHRLVDPLLDGLRRGETVDLVPDAIHRIPAQVICEMLGLSEVGIGERFRDWINGMIGVMNASVEADPIRRAELHRRGAEAQEEILAFCADVLESRRADPDANDVVRLLARSNLAEPPEDESDPRFGAPHCVMTDRDLHAQIAQLVIAAQDNTANMMSAALVYLARYPEVRMALLEDRELLEPVIEELLRHHGSIMVTPRLVRPGGAEIAGASIPEGSRVWVLNGAANRDPTRWENPDEFDIYRERKANVAFGFGIHNCIGINLARLELRTFITRVLDRVPSYELATDDIDYGTVFFTRGPQSVPVRAR